MSKAVMSMHKLTAGDGYRYLTRHVAAGDAGLSAADSLTAYYEASGSPPGRWHGAGLGGLGTDRARLRSGDRVTEEAMGALFGEGRNPITLEPLGRPYPRFNTPSDDGAGTTAAFVGKTKRANDTLGNAPAVPGAGPGKTSVKSAVADETPAVPDGCVNKAAPGDDPGRESAASRARHAVVGYDLTFTVPKSVSVLWALGDEATQAKVYAAHQAAVASALEFVEAKVVRTRIGEGGKTQVKTLGMIAAAFDHWDTRASDPNLHTHVVVANKVQGPDGLWRSLDGRTVHAAVVTVSELYDTLLADEIARRLPVTWAMRERGERRNPAFEITGVDDRLLAAFSSRSEGIHEAEQEWREAYTAKHGREPTRTETTRARQHLTRATRPAKVVRSLADLRAEWANRARALTGKEPHDLATAALQGRYGRALHAHDVGPEVRESLVAQVVADVSMRRSVWTTWNLGASALRAGKLLRMASPAERLTLLNQITTTAARACVHLDDNRDPATRRVGEDLFTSTELLAAEKVLLDAADARTFPSQHDFQLHGTATDTRFAALAQDQRAAVEAICTSGRALDALVGPAGSGKTTTLAALAAHWAATIGPVVALAPSATAAHTLARALSVPAETTAKWLHETVGQGAARRSAAYARLTAAMTPSDGYDKRRRAELAHQILRAQQDQWRLTPGQLVIIDEASLADTRTLATLTQQAQAARAKVLLVGDHHQRGAVDAGGAFGMLARRGPTAELTSLWRFTNPWEARASLQLRRGHTDVLDTYAQHGAFRAGDLDTMLDAALTSAAEAHDAGRVAILQAVDARTVTELNTRVRAERVLSGHVARDGGVTLHNGLTASTGDRVITRRNNRHLHTATGFVRNGDLWDITALLPDGGLLARPARLAGRPGVRDDAGARGGDVVRLPAAYVAEHLDLGYATTTARAQGITVDESHTIAAPGMGREDLYVAMTRGRHTNQTYVVTEYPDDDCDAATGTTPAAPASGRETLEQILATTHAERSATETWHDYHPDQAPPLPPVSANSPMRLFPEQGLRRTPPPTPTRDIPGIRR